MADAHLLGVWGIRQNEEFSLPLMKGWFRHYAECGVRPHNMHITILTDDLEYGEVGRRWIEDFGVEDVKSKFSERFNFFEVTQARRDLQRRISSTDWFINPDMDELIAFTDSVPNLINWLVKNDFNYADGDIRDRFANDYVLRRIIDDLPLHLQFPLSFDFTNGVLGANPRKVTIALNCFTIEIGCHWLSNSSQVSFRYSPLRFPIDHYKWDAGLKIRCERLREHVKARYSENEVPWRGEYDILLDCIEGDRINVKKYRNKMLVNPITS